MMAEEGRFELPRRVTNLRAFQARPFSLLGIPPFIAVGYVLYQIKMKLPPLIY